MEQQKITIENLKCGGCAATIIKGISSIENISNVNVNVEDSMVTFEASKDDTLKVKEKLSKLGYPEVGDKNSVLHKAKSYVSCAVGKMNS